MLVLPHNWCKIHKLQLQEISEATFSAEVEVEILFEEEGVGRNETFSFTARLELEPEETEK